MAPIGDKKLAPVVLIIFNRPHLTQLVFDQIRLAQPEQLIVISDGPRPRVESDFQKVEAARAITEKVDWECSVTRDYSATNLGCRNRIVTGLNFAFSLVPEAIILEDDCVPNLDFFYFCTELLEKYRDTNEIFSIGGSLWELPDQKSGPSYSVSKYLSVWGWATWADRWELIDHTMTNWQRLRETDWLHHVCASPMEVVFWHKMFDLTSQTGSPLAQAWDYAIQFALWELGLRVIRPHVNLIHNTGFSTDATHTKMPNQMVTTRQPTSLQWPLAHPPNLMFNTNRDLALQRLRFGGPSLSGLAKNP